MADSIRVAQPIRSQDLHQQQNYPNMTKYLSTFKSRLRELIRQIKSSQGLYFQDQTSLINNLVRTLDEPSDWLIVKLGKTQIGCLLPQSCPLVSLFQALGQWGLPLVADLALSRPRFPAIVPTPGEGLLPEKSGRGERPAS